MSRTAGHDGGLVGDDAHRRAVHAAETHHDILGTQCSCTSKK